MQHTLSLLLPLAGILIGTKIAAHLCKKIGLPSVFGELLLGVLISPSVFNLIAPSETLQLLANIGVIILMFLAGLETDTEEMRRVGKPAFLSALGGVILPLVGGYAIGVANGFSTLQSLFLGAVLTATSVSISAQTLRELGSLRSVEGNTILSAAIIDDVLGVVIFGIVMALTGEGNLFFTLIKMAVFIPVAWFIGDRVIPLILAWGKRVENEAVILPVIFGVLLIYAWAAEVLGSIAAITGAYLLGVIVARHIPQQHAFHEGMNNIGLGFFIPIFFVNVGLQTNLSGLTTSPVLAVQLIALAIGTKIFGSGLGARIGGLKPVKSLRIGIGMISRGEVALVVAGAGLTNGLLTGEMFALLIIVTLVTTLITPPMLRLSFANVTAAEFSDAFKSVRAKLHLERSPDYITEE